MRFSDVLQQKEPAYAVFTSAMKIVFDADDAVTEHIERLSVEARLVYLVWCLDGEIHNGGFDQFFYNSLGNYSMELLDHLKTISAAKSWKLLSHAVSLFPDSAPAQNREVRWEQLKKLDNTEFQARLSDLDEKFWKYEDNLASRVDEFVRKNPDATVAAASG
jgi:ElaB/YqjD/DUF883 family membrane-anchored ribosome-binding protein